MKHRILLLVFILSTAFIAQAQRPFITIWNTANPGVSASNQIIIPATGTNFNIGWVNTANPADTGNAVGNGQTTVTFTGTGIYKVYIRPGSGSFSAMTFNYSKDMNKILSIEQWGDIAWQTFDDAYFGCTNLVLNAVDVPNLSAVTNMRLAFGFCTSMTTNTAMNSWNVSNVTLMDSMFYAAKTFNQNINNWNVSKVTSMSYMFAGANSFNQPLANWDVSRVQVMSQMFSGATVFNQPIGNWNVISVVDMNNMFWEASAFNQPIGNWNVSDVDNMTNMFEGATSFNQAIGNWNVSNVSSTAGMFQDAKAFNQDISSWNISNIWNMENMFKGATSFNKPLNGWNIANVSYVDNMFSGASSFNQPLSNWNFSSILNMASMLDNCGMDCNNYSLSLKGWAMNAAIPYGLKLGAAGLSYDSAYAYSARDTILVLNKKWTISGDVMGHCTVGISNSPKPFITIWNTNNPGVTYTNQIVFPVVGNNYNISWVNTENPTDIGNSVGNGTDTITFANPGIYKVYISPGAGTVSAIAFNNSNDVDRLKIIGIEQWGDIAWTTFNAAFSGCDSLIIINAPDAPNLSNVTDMSFAFSNCSSLAASPAMNTWDVSNVKNMSFMFSSDTAFNQNISNWNVGNVTNMNGMFQYDSAFNQPLNNWNVSNVANMTGMFTNAPVFNQPLNNWNVSKVTVMAGMFAGAAAFNQDISNWNVSNVTIMNFMFSGPSSFNQPLNNWNVSNVTDMGYMFAGPGSFNQPLNNWNVSRVNYMESMFGGDNVFNQSLNNWNVSNVISMSGMFAGDNVFNQPIGNWNTGNVTDMSYMFAGATSFNQPLDNWNVSNVTKMGGMFQDASAFNQQLDLWNLSSYPNLTNLLDNSKMNCNNYSLTLKGWAMNPATPNSLILGAAGLSYDSAYANSARDTILIKNKGWTITGDVMGHCSVNNPLPVTLISFSAQRQENNTALLQWQTSSEINSAYFEIQRSVNNGANFSAIGKLSTTGGPGLTQSYQYLDNNPLLGAINYYRLKMVDIDGRFTYSEIKPVSFDGSPNSIMVYPNPARESIHFNVSKAGSLNLYNSYGALVKSIYLQPGTNTINISNLSAGNYFGKIDGQKIEFLKE